MPAKTLISPHWIPEHLRDSDLEAFRQLQPRSIKIINPDYERCRRAYEASPSSLFVLRDHPLSEQHEDMFRDPEGTGRRHAREYNEHVALWASMIPRNRIVVTGINEPRVWNPGGIEATTRYYVAFLNELRRYDLRGGALNLSVGWPANTGTDTPPNWDGYWPVYEALKGTDHFLVLHEYWDRNGPAPMWGWWAGRYTKCDWEVPIIIGECGLDQYVAGPTGIESRGWMSNASPAQYMGQLAEYDRRCMLDERIHSIQPFTCDYGNPWGTFDINSLWGAIISYNAGLPEEAPMPEPEQPYEPQPADITQAVRDTAWQVIGLPLNPEAAFPKYARAHDLGLPMTGEFDIESYRAQGFAGGIVYCKVGDWGNVKQIPW